MRLALINPPPRSPPRWERQRFLGVLFSVTSMGSLETFSHLNDEELKESLYNFTKELAELDPEFAEFAKQLAQQKRATKH